MHTGHLQDFQHEHGFGNDRKKGSERRTLAVAILTAVFMVVEVAAGILYGSMALLADGLHMGSHAVALGIAVFAYSYARRNAHSKRFSFGTGKVNALGGFAGALLLGVFAAIMAIESFERFLNPVTIVFDQAIAVAVVGLVVNGVSVAILGLHGGHGHGHDHDHAHDHELEKGQDHNLRAAYFHVLADALTSIAAIVALVAGKFFDQAWLDPAMGVVGALLIARWSVGLVRDSSRVLLDHQSAQSVQDGIRAAIEADTDDRVVDLHVWSIGSGLRAACITIVTHAPKPPPHYKALIPAGLHVEHATVEVHACPHEPAEG